MGAATHPLASFPCCGRVRTTPDRLPGRELVPIAPPSPPVEGRFGRDRGPHVAAASFTPLYGPRLGRHRCLCSLRWLHPSYPSWVSLLRCLTPRLGGGSRERGRGFGGFLLPTPTRREGEGDTLSPPSRPPASPRAPFPAGPPLGKGFVLASRVRAFPPPGKHPMRPSSSSPPLPPASQNCAAVRCGERPRRRLCLPPLGLGSAFGSLFVAAAGPRPCPARSPPGHEGPPP